LRRLTRRQRSAALALTLVAVVFIVTDAVGAPYAGARGGVQGFFGAMYRGTDSVLGPVRRWMGAVPHAGSDARTIRRLRAQLATLQARDAAQHTDVKTKAEIAALQAQATRGGYAVLPARVVAIGAGAGFDWTVTLDVGSSDRVRVGQTVLAGAALVGRVVRVSPTSATVLLAADPGSSVGVRDRRTGELGLVTGRGIRGFAFTALDPQAAVKAGDVLVSGPAATSTYVAGLVVGTVGTGPGPPVVPAVSPTALDVVGIALLTTTTGRRAPLRPGTISGGPR
jgi:rod shape-determining protein MreC